MRVDPVPVRVAVQPGCLVEDEARDPHRVDRRPRPGHAPRRRAPSPPRRAATGPGASLLHARAARCRPTCRCARCGSSHRPRGRTGGGCRPPRCMGGMSGTGAGSKCSAVSWRTCAVARQVYRPAAGSCSRRARLLSRAAVAPAAGALHGAADELLVRHGPAHRSRAARSPTGPTRSGSMSSPSIRIVGDPRIPSSSASSSEATATIWIGVSKASSVRTSTRFCRAGIAAGSPSAKSSSTRIGQLVAKKADERGHGERGERRRRRRSAAAPRRSSPRACSSRAATPGRARPGSARCSCRGRREPGRRATRATPTT